MSFELGIAKKDSQGKNALITIRKLSENELAQFQKANNDLLSFSENERLYKLTVMNYKEFLETIIKYAQQCERSQRM